MEYLHYPIFRLASEYHLNNNLYEKRVKMLIIHFVVVTRIFPLARRGHYQRIWRSCLWHEMQINNSFVAGGKCRAEITAILTTIVEIVLQTDFKLFYHFTCPKSLYRLIQMLSYIGMLPPFSARFSLTITIPILYKTRTYSLKLLLK